MKRRIFALLGLMMGLMAQSWAAEDGRYAQTITVAQDGSGDYKTINESQKNVTGEFEDPIRIYIKDSK